VGRVVVDLAAASETQMKTLLHTLAVLSGRDAPHSQVTPAELAILLGFAERAQAVVELGCYEGKTAVAMASRCKGLITTVDTFPRGRLGLRYGEIITRAHVRRMGAGNVRVLRATTTEAARGWTTPVDLLFVDADHSYQAVSADYAAWLPKVRVGGHVALHDSRPVGDARDQLGSIRFYREVVLRDGRVREVAAEHSLAVLERLQQ
jgi:predicted O-methyltransferase YrrM